MANYTSDVIDETTDDLKKLYDDACKKLLSDSQILTRILKYIVKEANDYSLEEIESFIRRVSIDEVMLNPGRRIETLNNESSIKDEGNARFDVYFYVDIPKVNNMFVNLRMYFDIEAQNESNPGYKIVTRGIAYCARMISQQFYSEMMHNTYGNMKKVHSIWIMPQSSDYLDGNIREYSLKEKVIAGIPLEDKESYDKMCITTIHLGENHHIEEKYEIMDELLSPLSVLFTNNISDSEEKKRIVKDEYGFKLTDAFNEEVDTMCNLSEGIARKNKAEGINEGRVLGRAEGRKEGIEIGRIESFVGLVKKGLLTIEQAANELGKSVEEFKTLMNK
jgi:hypothetical protein